MSSAQRAAFSHRHCADLSLNGKARYFSVPTGGQSITQGHIAMVFTLLSLFLITVTFMIDSCAPQRAMAGASSRCSYGQGWVCASAGRR